MELIHKRPLYNLILRKNSIKGRKKKKVKKLFTIVKQPMIQKVLTPKICILCVSMMDNVENILRVQKQKSESINTKLDL